MKKIINFLFKSYHRPSAKVEHIIMFLLSFLTNKSSRTFSERMMLLKIPPENQIYFNYFGRIINIILNLVTIFLFRKFFSKNLSLDNSNNEIPKQGSDLIYWPLQPYHYFVQQVFVLF